MVRYPSQTYLTYVNIAKKDFEKDPIKQAQNAMHRTHARPSLPVVPDLKPGPAKPGVIQLHDTAAHSFQRTLKFGFPNFPVQFSPFHCLF